MAQGLSRRLPYDLQLRLFRAAQRVRTVRKCSHRAGRKITWNAEELKTNHPDLRSNMSASNIAAVGKLRKHKATAALRVVRFVPQTGARWCTALANHRRQGRLPGLFVAWSTLDVGTSLRFEYQAVLQHRTDTRNRVVSPYGSNHERCDGSKQPDVHAKSVNCYQHGSNQQPHDGNYCFE